MSSPAPPIDIGAYLAESLKTAITAAISEFSLGQPAQVMMTPGTGIPLQDCCDGLLWVRLDTMWPTNGDGNPLAQARIDFSFPAFTIRLQAGILWCHPTVDPEGYAVDPAEEAEIAHRDSQYRLAIYAALTDPDAFPASIRDYADGMRLNPWAPYGPAGGCSGGSLLIDIITNRLCVPAIG